MNITTDRATQVTGLWWRVPLTIVIGVIGLWGCLMCSAGWLFMGWMGSHVQSWEPFVWPLGLAASVLVPVVSGRWILRQPGKRYWLVATGVVVVLLVAALIVAAGVVGAESS